MRVSPLVSGAALGLCLLASGSLGHEPIARADDVPSVTLDTLMARFRAMPGLFARYHEEKQIALLAKPLISEGTVHYAPTRRLARHTLTPQPASVILDGNSLRFGDGTSEEEVDLGANAVVRAFVSGFLQLLAGDRAALEKTFEIEQKPSSGDKWEILLRPRSPAIAGVITELSFAGRGAIVTRMRVLETSGDVAVTTFTDVDPKRKYSPEEIRQVFRIPKK